MRHLVFVVVSVDGQTPGTGCTSRYVYCGNSLYLLRSWDPAWRDRPVLRRQRDCQVHHHFPSYCGGVPQRQKARNPWLITDTYAAPPRASCLQCTIARAGDGYASIVHDRVVSRLELVAHVVMLVQYRTLGLFASFIPYIFHRTSREIDTQIEFFFESKM